MRTCSYMCVAVYGFIIVRNDVSLEPVSTSRYVASEPAITRSQSLNRMRRAALRPFCCERSKVSRAQAERGPVFERRGGRIVWQALRAPARLTASMNVTGFILRLRQVSVRGSVRARFQCRIRDPKNQL
jgi:hypothetical protein